MTRRRFARGGVIKGGGSPTDDRMAFVLNAGCAVVSASLLEQYSRRHIEFLGGGNVEVFTAEEVLAEYDAEDGLPSA